MTILIVSAFFPPENSIASLRPYSWAKWWTRAGHDVTVITTTKERLDNNLNLDCSGFKVVQTPLYMPFRNANKVVKEAQKNESEIHKQKKVVSASLKVKLLKNLKSLYTKFTRKTGCFSTCRFPDWHDFWVKSVIKQLNQNAFDLLVTTGGPYCVHRVGLAFRKNGWNGKWICDWRDLFTKNHLFHGLCIFHLYEKKLEKEIHKNADYITTVSSGLAETLCNLTKTPVEVIYNGFDEEEFIFLFNKTRKKNAKYTISYLGTVYRQYQAPDPLFQALAELDKTGQITPADVIVQFAGGESANVIDIAKKWGTEKYFKYLGFLPREQSLQLQYDSDSVLFLEYENQKVKGVLTGKLFEYLYVARNIMAVGCSNKTSAGELIEKCNAGICFGHDVEKIKDFLLREVRNIREKKSIIEQQKNISEIKSYDRKIQAMKMLDLIQT